MSDCPDLPQLIYFPLFQRSVGAGLRCCSQPRPVEGPLCESILRPALASLATLALGTGDQNSISCLSSLPSVWNSTRSHREEALHCVLCRDRSGSFGWGGESVAGPSDTGIF